MSSTVSYGLLKMISDAKRDKIDLPIECTDIDGTILHMIDPSMVSYATIQYGKYGYKEGSNRRKSVAFRGAIE